MRIVRIRQLVRAARTSLGPGHTTSRWSSGSTAVPANALATPSVEGAAPLASPGGGRGRLDPLQVRQLEEAKTLLYKHIRQTKDVRNRHLVDQLLQQIQADFPPCLYVFNIVLHANIMLNATQGIQKTLEMIKAAGLELNAISYNLLIVYYRNLQHPEEAERLMQKMVMAGLTPTRETYTTLVTAFARSSVRRAEGYFDAMLASIDPKGRPDVFAYNAMIEGYVINGHLSKVDRLLLDMQKDGIKPTAVTFKILIEGLLARGLQDSAWSMYKTALSSAPTIFTSRDLAELSRHFWRSKSPERALEILDNVDPQQLSKPLSTCLLSALCHVMKDKDRTRSLLLVEKYLAPYAHWFIGSLWLLLTLAKFDPDVLRAVQGIAGPLLHGKPAPLNH